MATRLLLTGCLLIMASAHASILQLCPESIPQAPGQQAGALVTRADGTLQRLRIVDRTTPGCRTLQLPLPVDAVIAMHPLPEDAASDTGSTLLLQGPEREGSFSIASATTSRRAPETPARQPMPLQANLLTGLSSRTFGMEERARATLADGKLHLQCAPGSKPAGVILAAPWYMTQARAGLQASAAGQGRFELAIADAAHAAKETSVVAGQFDTDSGTASIPLPAAGLDRAGWRHFSIACPHHKSELILTDLRLTPLSAARHERATWVWNASNWMNQADDVLKQAQRHGVRVLFLSVPVTEGKVDNPGQLALFIRRAREQGIETWTVDGDPRMVLAGEHAATAERVRAYAAYNHAAEPEARLAGLQFDIEHYLLPGYDAAGREMDRRYLDLARMLRRAAGTLPLEFVVPFWWSDKASLLQGLAGAASGLTVMDYRTAPEEIRQFAIPFLDWGARYGKTVRIALEAGPVEPEQQRRYHRAETGEAWIVRLGQLPVLLLLDEARPNPLGAAFRLESSRLFDGSATTFHKDAARLFDLLPQLESYFSAWASFRGMALHEVD